jgi:hypothetical protein
MATFNLQDSAIASHETLCYVLDSVRLFCLLVLSFILVCFLFLTIYTFFAILLPTFCVPNVMEQEPG